MAEEYILDPANNRLTLFPIKHWGVYEFAKKMQAAEWRSEEIAFSDDLDDWNNKLNTEERHFIEQFLAFFSSFDVLVADNLNSNFSEEVQIPEARMAYSFQEKQEWIHSEVYSLFIVTLFGKNPAKMDSVINAIREHPTIRKMGKWAEKWMNKDTIPFAERLYAFAIIEGVFFSGPFCSIFWLKKRGLMPQLCKSNEWISTDEAIHVTLAVKIVELLLNKISAIRAKEIMTEAVALAEELIANALPVRLIGMNHSDMVEYIRYTADRLNMMFKIQPFYDAKCPFDWMANICLDVKSNFFEKVDTNYQQSGVMEKFRERREIAEASTVITFDTDADDY